VTSAIFPASLLICRLLINRYFLYRLVLNTVVDETKQVMYCTSRYEIQSDWYEI
jgi:hypothetical protein